MRGSDNEDQLLVKELLAGDRDAFDRFFQIYFPRLFRFAQTRLQGNVDLAEELVQVTLCKAMKKLDTFRGEATLFTWLCTICRREISRFFTRNKMAMSPTQPLEDHPEIRAALESLGRAPESPEREVMKNELARLVHLTLDHLKPHHAKVLEMKYLHGLAVKEIAIRLDLGNKAVESMLTRARKAFRDGFSSLTKTVHTPQSGWSRRQS